MDRLFRRVIALFGIIVLTFLPVMTPTAYAVESWSGDPWEGNPWSGDPWDGSELEWSGDSWNSEGWKGSKWNGTNWSQGGWNSSGFDGNDWKQQGWSSPYFQGDSWIQQDWNGSDFEGNSWTTNGWNGQQFEGSPWANSGWSMYGYNGTPWSSSGWTGNDILGSPWSNSGWKGEGSEGNPWLIPGFNGTPGTGTEVITSDPTDPSFKPGEQFYDTDEFKATKYVWDSVVNGVVDFDPNRPGGLSPNYVRSVFADSIKLQYGNHVAFDLYDIGDKGYSAYDSYSKLEGFRQAAFNTNAASLTNNAYQVSTASKFAQYGGLIKDSARTVWNNMDIANVSSTWGSMGAISKLNFVASGVNAGLSAYKTGVSVSNAVNTWQSTTDGSERTAAIADVGANLGETLMSAGGVAAAIPGGQAVGAGLIVVGGGLYVVSKTTQVVAKNWDKIAGATKKAGSAIKNAGKSVVDGAKKLGSTIKGWFS
ncbi:hypothetical protein [Ornithinibacillus xuwenensis]|uniref:Uncharacterized protein n=1 Tax=Ornithinibacillus xuwenensis TaxID=3144668 RepID=A0ABU9XGX3_9BACI